MTNMLKNWQNRLKTIACEKAAKDNLVLKEAERWLTETKLVDWFWPYFSPESAKPIQKKGEYYKD